MSYSYSLHASYSWTKKSGFYLDAKALRLIYKTKYLKSLLRNLRRRLEVNTRHLDKINFYSTKAKLGWFGSLRRRLDEKESIASKEARLAKLRAEFETRIRWESKEAQQHYRKWLCDKKRRQDEKNDWKIKQKRRDRERWEGKWQKFLLSKKSKKEVSGGHPELWGSFLF
ncbi:unnamed protein product [Fusarium fujikuroi]|uniref:Uncharacterized protein n=1 Tax=Fusarium fujikuroi TaxID=5127 RepID=A0A9Q9RAM4_FUSFU|nr:unnamed protein product [Fusarium fujikuroi]